MWTFIETRFSFAGYYSLRSHNNMNCFIGRWATIITAGRGSLFSATGSLLFGSLKLGIKNGNGNWDVGKNRLEMGFNPPPTTWFSLHALTYLVHNIMCRQMYHAYYISKGIRSQVLIDTLNRLPNHYSVDILPTLDQQLLSTDCGLRCWWSVNEVLIKGID